MASLLIDNLAWKGGLLPCYLVASLGQLVSGGCGGSRDGYQHEQDKCWYELWYFWFIIVLVFITIVILVIFYCKQQAKRSSGRRGRRRTPVLTMPVAPPQYEVPGHEPPPYHIAMTTSTVPDAVIPSAGTGAPSSASSQQVPSLPGYIMDANDFRHAYDNLSMASTVSLGAMSDPPPYSRPPSSYPRHSQHHRPDVAL